MRQCGIIKVGTGLGDTMKKLKHRRSSAAGILYDMAAANRFDAGSNTPTTVCGPPPDFNPRNNELGNVYGPPSENNLTRRAFTAAGILAAMGAAAAFVSSCNRPVCVYGPPPDYDPDENELETVYGPPEDYEPDDSEESGSTSSESTTFDPAENELVDVYGPPEDVDPDDNMLINDYGQSEDD